MAVEKMNRMSETILRKNIHNLNNKNGPSNSDASIISKIAVADNKVLHFVHFTYDDLICFLKALK